MYKRQAVPSFKSFADVLAARGYVVYNTGIVGNDPAYYAAIAKLYVPFLQPDFIIVNYFAGNDHVWVKKKIEPFSYSYYPTNAGWLQANMSGYFLTMEEADEINAGQIRIPFQKTNKVNRLFAKTSFTTLLWKAMAKWGWMENWQSIEMEHKHREMLSSQDSYSEWFVEKIDSVGSIHGAQTIVSVIKEVRDFNRDYEAEMARVFKNTPYHIFHDVEESDYNLGTDGHFNNEGHRKYADFLEKLITRKP